MGDFNSHASLLSGEASQLLELGVVSTEAAPRVLLVRGEELVDLRKARVDSSGFKV